MSDRIRDWFDKLENVLNAQAEFAGLLSHNVTIGQLREFFTKKVLARFLPSNLTVGSGQVISTNNKQISKQIDVIIYDNNFPRFSFTGDPDNSLYPVEGVLATIELKTNLYKEDLTKALDNCYSVSTLDIDIDTEHKSNIIEQIKAKREVCVDFAEQILYWRIAPRTYIFAFQGYSTNEGLKNAVNDWHTNKLNFEGTFYNPCLPRVIVAGDVVGLARDEKINMSGNDVFAAFKWKSKFGLLASHLLSHITDRLRPTDKTVGFSYLFHKYIPFKNYAEEIKKIEKIGFYFTTEKEFKKIKNHKNPPEELAKEVKMEAGYGCSVCGCPIFGYHYITQYERDDELFHIENIMILCNIHQMYSYREIEPKITEEELINYKKQPYNIKKGNKAGLIRINTSNVMIKPFDNQYLSKENDCSPFEIDSESVIQFSVGENDNLEISMDFYDNEGNLLANMNKNVFISKAPILWTFKFSDQCIKISQKDNHIFLNLSIEESIIEMEADFWWKGYRIKIDNNNYQTLQV